MKMNLSVVLSAVDKMTAPLRDITANQTRFNTKITEAQTALKDTTGSLAQVASLQKLGQQSAVTDASLREQRSQLAKLNEIQKQNGTLTAAQQKKWHAAQLRISSLTETKKKQRSEMNQLNASLRKSGVDTSNLTKEAARLNREYADQEKLLTTLSNRFEALKKAGDWSAKAHGMIRLPKASELKSAAIGVAGLAASAAGYFRIINNQADAMGALQDTADTLNIPISELQALHYQGKLAGAGADAVTSSLNVLSRRLGKLQSADSGILAAFLKRSRNPLLGELKNAKSTEEAYQSVVKAFGKLKTEQEQVAFADAAFGGSAKSMLLMLREGTDGLSAAREEFVALGGGFKEEDSRAAVSFGASWLKIQEIFNSIKAAALAPVMRELTKIFEDFAEKFKNIEGREEIIEQAKFAMLGLFNGIRTGFNVLKTLINYFPEIVAGLVSLKIAFFAINAVMLANPIGLVVAGIAALVTGLTYAYTRSETFRKIIHMTWGGIKKFGSAVFEIGAAITTVFTNIGRSIVRGMLTPVRMIFSLLAKIPARFLPGGLADGISKFNDKVQSFAAPVTTHQDQSSPEPTADHQPGQPGNTKSSESQTYQPLKNQVVQAKSEATIKIRSDLPVEIERVNTDSNTDLNVQTGDLFGVSF